MNLNIGCGDLRTRWLDTDVQPAVRPDLAADIRALPFADDTFGRCYAGHVLEHLDLDDITRALREVRRVTVGPVCFVGPDYDRAVTQHEDPVLLDLIVNGGGRWSGDEHRWLSTGTRALELIRSVFPDAADVPVADVEGFPVAFRVEWQFAICAS